MSVDTQSVRELVLFTENNYAIYKAREDYLKNVVRKIAAGKYNHEEALKLWAYYADRAAKAYAKEYGGVWNQMFPPAVRKEAAKELRDGGLSDLVYEEVDVDKWVPKKYAADYPKHLAALKGRVSNPSRRKSKGRRMNPGKRKKSYVKTRNKVIAVRINAGNDRNGNPRRGWQCWGSTSGKYLGFVNEGYGGLEALTSVFPNYMELRTISATVAEYNKAAKTALPSY